MQFAFKTHSFLLSAQDSIDFPYKKMEGGRKDGDPIENSSDSQLHQNIQDANLETTNPNPNPSLSEPSTDAASSSGVVREMSLSQLQSYVSAMDSINYPGIESSASASAMQHNTGHDSAMQHNPGIESSQNTSHDAASPARSRSEGVSHREVSATPSVASSSTSPSVPASSASLTFEKMLSVIRRRVLIRTFIRYIESPVSGEVVNECMIQGTFSANMLAKNQNFCSICQEEFVEGDKVGSLAYCDHIFHFECIKRWLAVKNTCPLCKMPALRRFYPRNQ